ncbi:alpha/beta hydrolase [Streptomyces brasiliensis]|uniref:Esterase n=1 Tax=Streptomyces brasiliensis TaxID=1954 RepID=A0A917L6R9_9ACTN|nr:alpha/beta hydrolase [Streptomyces brasiliensis]GGJ48676.1 esterase [Streptomyces brasiliensis]
MPSIRKRGISRKTAVAAVFSLALGTFAATSALAVPAQSKSTPEWPLVLEPDAKAFADAAAKTPPIYTLSPADARKALEDVQSGPIDKLPADISHRTLKVGPTGTVDIRIVRPEGVTGKLPAVVYTHGGGWVLGSENTHDRLVRQIANGAHAAVIFVDYTPSPEAQFPVPIEQAYAVTKWVAEHGDDINVDGSRLAIAGDSVGGNMATAVTLMAKQRGGPKLDGQVMMYPVTNADFNTDSYHTFANGPWLTRKSMQWFWDNYAPNKKDRENILASPLRASLNQLKGLPKTLLITDEGDVLRDEGEAYAAKLRAAGTDITTVRYQGTIHDFAMLNPVANTNATKAAVKQVSEFLYDDLYGRS